MDERRTGTTTFLFTDIVGSTRRWDLDADSMRLALAAHDEVLRRAIEVHGGNRFKHTGDGVVAVFESPQAAIDAAVAAQRELELPVRMGIASGHTEARDDDYFGPVVNCAARVMAAGHGGQILVADSTASLVSTSEFVDLGIHRLRDIAQPIRIFQVTGDGLATTFPQVRTLTAAQGNLPASTSTFVGRGAQLDELVADLDDHRLITLTGPGGIGKTRLAVEAAHAVVGDFRDGAWIVELAATNDAATVPALVANAFTITAQPNQSITESILHALTGRRLLLVLDNCEHVVGAAGELVEAIVRSIDSVTVLATSREGLGIDGERLWPVRSFEADAGLRSDAVTLFLERARAVDPRFTLAEGSDDLDAVIAVCRGLDGLPLGIELAAARMVSMSPQEVLARLGDRFRLLASSQRRSTTQRTLRDTVAWSYDLLDDDERNLLDRCAVFSGAFELDAVMAIGEEEWDEFTVLDLLDSLVRKSLITARKDGNRTRYQMLETIRSFADEQLDEHHLSSEVHRAHATYFADRARTNWEIWNSPQQRAAIDWVDTEFAELRSAFHWATAHGAIELATRIAAHTAMLSFVLQRFEPMTWAVQTLDAATAADVAELPRLFTAASVGALTGAEDAALSYSRTAQRLETDPRYDPFEAGWSRYWEACAHRYGAGVDRYIEICDELSALDGFQRVVGRCGNLGVLAGVGRDEDARAMSDETVQVARDHGVPFWIGFAMASWARAHATHDPVAALDMLRTSLDYAREHRLEYLHAVILREIAALQDSGGSVADALEKFATVIEWYRSAGNHGSVATTLGDIAIMFDRLDRPEIAATVYGTSIPRGQSIASGLPATLVRLRTALGDERFDRCVATGSAMDFNDAMIYVGRAIETEREHLEASDQAPTHASDPLHR